MFEMSVFLIRNFQNENGENVAAQVEHKVRQLLEKSNR